jgi:DNA-binding MarR family transcriptional regulator
MTDSEMPSTLAFGSRLRRLLERLDREVLAIYQAAGVSFEPRCYAVFAALKANGPTTVAEMAERLNTSPAAVIQVRSALQADGLVGTRADPADGARQQMTLTPKGAATALQLQPLWDAINAATAEALAQDAPGLLVGLEGFVKGLDRRPLQDRVKDIL